jgi:hypothetical protein
MSRLPSGHKLDENPQDQGGRNWLPLGIANLHRRDTKPRYRNRDYYHLPSPTFTPTLTHKLAAWNNPSVSFVPRPISQCATIRRSG